MREILLKRSLVLALLCGILGWCVGCGSDGGASGTDSDVWLRPGACVCYDGTFNFRSCVVTADLQTCRQTVTTCNPFFFTNTDCSRWCPWSPQECY
jgi:hypothetical protein